MPQGDAPSDAILEKKQKRVRTICVISAGIGVLQGVVRLQSEVALFTQAAGGDYAPAARALATTTGLASMASIIVNQLAGKLSDCFGRRPLMVPSNAVNLLCAMAMLKRSKSMLVLMVARVIREVVASLQGIAMGAAVADCLDQKEAAQVGPMVQTAVGIAVIAGPYIESRILKFGKGDPRSAYKAVIPLCVSQLFINFLLLPETLPKEKRASFQKFLESVASINPFAFLKVYFGKNQLLKKLLTIQTLQSCSDGKVTADLTQLWLRNNLGWGTNGISAFASVWGAIVMAGSAFVHPYLLKKYCTRTYSTIGNLSVWLGITMQGSPVLTVLMSWCGLPVLLGGVNRGSQHAISALTVKKAQAAGYDNGEWTAWTNNMGGMAQSLAIIFLGRWYAMCKGRGIYQGTAWFIAGFLAGGLPQLLIWTTPRKAFEQD